MEEYGALDLIFPFPNFSALSSPSPAILPFLILRLFQAMLKLYAYIALNSFQSGITLLSQYCFSFKSAIESDCCFHCRYKDIRFKVLTDFLKDMQSII